MDRWSRRQFVQDAGAAGLALLAGCGWLPGQARQPPTASRVGLLSIASASEGTAQQLAPLREGLHQLGYVEGQTVVLEPRYADGQASRVPELAAELVQLPVDVIVTQGPAPALAAHAATSTLPLVVVYPADPVADGLVTSFAHPGGNVTGLGTLAADLARKRLDLLRETLPGLSRVVVLQDTSLPHAVREFRELQTAAEALGVRLQPLPAREPGELAAAFETATGEGAEALVLGGGAVFADQGFWAPLVALAAEHHLPATYWDPRFVRAGGLMSYAASSPAQVRRAAYYVDRILKGAKPADLPVEQPREFEFVINLKTAQALGLTIPQSVLLQATEVIQ